MQMSVPVTSVTLPAFFRVSFTSYSSKKALHKQLTSQRSKSPLERNSLTFSVSLLGTTFPDALTDPITWRWGSCVKIKGNFKGLLLAKKSLFLSPG